MAIENNKTSVENKTATSTPSSPSTFLDIEKLKQETGKKVRGPYKKKEKDEITKQGWKIFNEDKKELSEEEIEKMRIACYSDGVQISIQTIYKKGLQSIIFIDFKFSKIDTKFLPEKPISDNDAKAWALALTDYLIENFGPAQTLKYLRPCVLIGQPIIAIGQAHITGKLDQAEKQIDKVIKEKEQNGK